MLIVYCEQCTLRIPAAELSDGSAVQMEENKYLCAGCAKTAGVTATAAPRRKSTGIITAISAPAPVDEPAPVVEPRSKSNMRPASARSTGRQPNPMDTATRHASVASHAPVKAGPPVGLIAGGVGGVLVLILLVAMSGDSDAGKDKEKKVAALATTTPLTSSPAATTRPNGAAAVQANAIRNGPAGGSGGSGPGQQTQAGDDAALRRVTAPTTVTPPAAPTPPAPVEERAAQSDPRQESAARRLAEAKDFFKREPDDPWTYGEMLDTLVKHYRGTPPAEEASTLLTDLNLASLGPRPKDWHKEWKISNTKSVSMLDSHSGKKGVLKVVAKDKNGAKLTRRFAITADKPILQFGARAVDKGDFEFGIELQGQRLHTEVLSGGRWRFYAINLAGAAGREGELTLVVKPNGGTNEAGYFTQPRLIVSPTDDAKVFDIQVQVADAGKPAGPTPPAPPPPPPPPPAQPKKDDKTEKPADKPKTDNPFEKASEEKEKGDPQKKDPPPPTAPQAAKTAEAGTPFGNATQVDSPLAAEYEKLLTDAYAALIKQDVNGAKTLIGDARGNFKFLPLTEQLEHDGEIIGYGEALSKAVLDGLNSLISNRQTLKLRRRDGKELMLSKSTGIAAVKDGVIHIEADLRGSKVTQQLELTQLTWQSRYELAKLALPPGPETELKLAFAGILALFADAEPKIEPTPGTVLKHIEAGRKGEGLSGRADHLRRRLERQERELGAETLVAEIDKLVLADKKKEAIDAIQKFKADFAGSRALKRFEPQLNDRLNLLQGK